MFENGYCGYFLPHDLNTSVFGNPTQIQFSTPIPRAIFNSCTLAAAVRCNAVAVHRRLKIDREQISQYLGG